jgi:mono/diheme cytochrome c family protein
MGRAQELPSHLPMPTRSFRVVITTLAVVAGAAVLSVALFVRSGLYDVAADRSHTQVVYTLLETALRYSVQREARGIEEPVLMSPQLVTRGALCFREHCVACHGAPGVAPGPAGLAMQPLPGPLVDAAQRWRARELVWLTRHGIRMSGMPAWGQRLDDDDIWALAAFMLQLPMLSSADYARLSAALPGHDCAIGAQDGSAPALTLLRSEVDDPPPRSDAAMRRLGRIALRRHACHGCHMIPGVVGSQVHVGPALHGYGLRTTIKGRIPNTAANLASWIRDPQAIDPGSTMPATGVGESDARAIAAYLRSLR